MKKIFLLAVLIGVMFTIFGIDVKAASCPRGQVYMAGENGAGCFFSNQKINSDIFVNTATATSSITAINFQDKNTRVKVAATIPDLTSWESTSWTFEGQSSVCLNHGINKTTSSGEYYALLPIYATTTPGEYDFAVTIYSEKDCEGASTVKTRMMKVNKPCLNCDDTKEGDQKAESKSSSVSQSDAVTSSNADTQKRQERKQRVDAFIQTYQNNPDFKEILFLIQLLIALDIIQI